MEYNFASAVDQWLRLPFDNVSYLDSNKVLAMTSVEIEDFVHTFESNRYALDGWRNYQNRWRDYLGLDTTTGKRVIDFGCGFGIEALQFLKQGNTVVLADINGTNLAAAKHLLGVMGYGEVQTVLVSGGYPFFDCDPYDIFYSNGVLHHTPMIREILSRSRELLMPGGEARLMLYSDRAWANRFDSPPDPTIDVREDSKFRAFVRSMDGTGLYANWFNEEKLRVTVKGVYTVVSFKYICGGADPILDDQYSVAVLQ